MALGDFNAVPAALRPGLGRCRLPEREGAPTWPSALPAALGASIDHVMTTPELRVDDAVTLRRDAAWTDHRPIAAIVRRPR